jgi:hypothetical protein
MQDTADTAGMGELEESVGADTWRGAMTALGYYDLLCEGNPSGAYSLSLAAPLDRLVVGLCRLTLSNPR